MIKKELSELAKRRIDGEQQLESAKAQATVHGLKYHHTAAEWGYYPTGLVMVNKYCGKFGDGVKICYHSPGDSGNFHAVEYWIKED